MSAVMAQAPHDGLRAVTNGRAKTGLSPQEAAQALAKINRYNGHTTRLYSVAEHSLHVCQILERDLRVTHCETLLYEREVRGQSYVFQRCEGINIGDRLTDNAMEADDYRFHDAFHFAHMAVLTWSPVLRSLLRLKRKSEPRVDEAEDGARAILVEEGVTNWIFGQAARLDFFAGMKSGDLSLDLLKQVRQFVAGYEADRCPLWVWEEAILQGCTAFRYLRQHRRGRLTVDMKNRRLSIEALT